MISDVVRCSLHPPGEPTARRRLLDRFRVPRIAILDTGFAHFDRSHTENFGAAVLCLVLETEPAARVAMVDLLTATLADRGLRALGKLTAVSREDRLDASASREWQRADLSLRFEAGLVLVEVKAHAWWSLEHVCKQLDEQAGSAGHVRQREAPLAVVLLAPTGLAARVAASGRPAISWAGLCRLLRQSPTPLLTRAIQHWETHVERPFGVPQPFAGDEASFAGPIQRVAALRALLVACLHDIQEQPDGASLNLTGESGAPREKPGWKWHGMSVPIRTSERAKAKHARIGLYWYVEGESGAGAAWLELYLTHNDVEDVAVPFDVPDFDAPSLELMRERFRAATEVWRKKPVVSA